MASVDRDSSAPRAGLVLYAKQLEPMAGFYAAVLGSPVDQIADDHVVLDGGAIELTIVAIPAAIAASIEIARPPERREDTPMKPAFVVDDLARARRAAIDVGGVVDDPSNEWTFRGVTHCDGHDPEGNVFQLRQRATYTSGQG